MLYTDIELPKATEHSVKRQHVQTLKLVINKFRFKKTSNDMQKTYAP